MNLTDEQRERLKKGEPVEVSEPGIGVIVLLPSDVYQRYRDALQQKEFAGLAKKAANNWAKDNPY